jgi:hypothetical protein
LDDWQESYIKYRDWKRSPHPEDYEPVTRKMPRATRVGGKRMCSKAKTEPCDFSLNVVVWTSYVNNKKIEYVSKKCSRCGRVDWPAIPLL